jgi:hypothetical protein
MMHPAPLALLRERAPGAVYDDRLLSRKASAERTEAAGVTGARTVKTSSEGGIDLLVHVRVLWIDVGALNRHAGAGRAQNAFDVNAAA